MCDNLFLKGSKLGRMCNIGFGIHIRLKWNIIFISILGRMRQLYFDARAISVNTLSRAHTTSRFYNNCLYYLIKKGNETSC